MCLFFLKIYILQKSTNFNPIRHHQVQVLIATSLTTGTCIWLLVTAYWQWPKSISDKYVFNDATPSLTLRGRFKGEAWKRWFYNYCIIFAGTLHPRFPVTHGYNIYANHYYMSFISWYIYTISLYLRFIIWQEQFYGHIISTYSWE
jgi:hypothetical protein